MTTLYAVLLGCLRKTISRTLVLIVSMGFGVVLPYLGAIQKKVRSRGCLELPSADPFCCICWIEFAVRTSLLLSISTLSMGSLSILCYILPSEYHADLQTCGVLSRSRGRL